MDFSGNGSWVASEQIYTNAPVGAGVTVLPGFTVPAAATLGNMVSRFRISSATGLSFTGLAGDGEVEDYVNGVTEVTVAVAPLTVLEDGVPNLVYTFTRTGPTGSALTANFSVAGTATFNNDYTQSGAAGFTATTGTVTFGAGSATALVTLDPTADTITEPDETAILTVTPGAGYGIGSANTATGTIIDDDTQVTVVESPATVLEDGAVNLEYTFSRTGVTTSPLSVNFSVGGSATFATDYTQTGAASFAAAAGTVTFGVGEATKKVTLDPTVDMVVEPDETAVLTIVAGAGYAVGSPAAATGTIVNDDTDVSVVVAPLTVLEDGAVNLVYTFTRVGVTSGALTVGFGVSGSATFNTDYTQAGAATYTATAGTVAFTPGSSTATVTLDPTADTTVEPDETAILTLSAGAGYKVVAPIAATGTITNDDSDITVAVSPGSVAEDGAANLIYTFTRTGTTAPITINFAVGGTATFNTDYTQTGATTFGAAAGTVTMGAGVTTAAVTLDPTADTTVEADETASLTIVAGAGYNVGIPSAATGTIANDDTDVTVAVAPASVNEDGAANLVYTFTRTGVTTGALTANFNVAGSATFSTDYTQSGAATYSGSAGTVVFSAGSSTAAVTVDPTADGIVEPDETVDLTVIAGAGYQVAAPAAATGTILNDDSTVTVAVAPATVEEDGAVNLVYTFTRVGSTTAGLTVGFGVSGTATFGTDYTQTGATTFIASAGTATFGAGATTTTITVDPTADSDVELDETVVLTLTGGAGHTVGSPSAASGVIENDDIPQIKGKKLDANSMGLGGFTIELFTDDGDDIFEPGGFGIVGQDGVPKTTVSLPNGDYFFLGQALLPGKYFVREVQQQGWHQTSPLNPDYYTVVLVDGADPDIFGDPDPTSYDFQNAQCNVVGNAADGSVIATITPAHPGILTIWVDSGASISDVQIVQGAPANGSTFSAYDGAGGLTTGLSNVAGREEEAQLVLSGQDLSRVDILVTAAHVAEEDSFAVTVSGSAGAATLRWLNAVNVDVAGTLALKIEGSECGELIAVGDDHVPGGAGLGEEIGGPSDAKAIFIGTHSSPIANGVVQTASGIKYRTDIIDAMFGAPTISRVEINGNDGDDVIRVTDKISQQSTLNGGVGNDNIRGGAGKATIFGGPGHDLMVGGGADDVLIGGDGDDSLVGLAGADRAFGGKGNDWIAGGADNDALLRGGDGDDRISGGAGGDRLLGDADADLLYRDGADLLVSGGTPVSTPPDPVDDALLDLIDNYWNDEFDGDGDDTLDELIDCFVRRICG